MQKKLLAVAVAGVLAAPAVALAQSSVTISGYLSLSTGTYKISNPNAARVGNTSENRMTDNSSRIVFSVVEDLGGGLAAVGQVDWRIAPDNGADGGGPGGNNHVGLRSKNWGRIIFGRQDVHYFGRESELTVKGDLKADSISLLSFMQSGAAGAQVAIANASRTPNIIHYASPNWGGFSGVVAYSFNSAANEADIGTGVRKGSAWNIAPTFEAANWTAGYSYFRNKFDAGVSPDQRGDRLFGSFRWAGFKIGLAWDKSRLNAVAGGGETNRRTTWSIPGSWTFGPHEIHAHYTKARDDVDTAAQDGAKMWAVMYAYSLSKRTSMSLTYAKITNDAGATYTPFTSNAATIGTGAGGTVLAGEDPSLLTFTLKHAF